MLRSLLLVAAVFLFTSCAHEPKSLSLDQSRAYVGSTLVSNSKIETPKEDRELFTEHCPMFVIEEENKSYNKIGEPKIKRVVQDKLEAYVDPSSAKIYTQKRTFMTERGTYTNLIYRVHFEKVPYMLMPFHVAAGKNVGLLVVVTLDSKNLPVLVTTVHTCGCYISIIPTNHLEKGAFPIDWKPEPNYRYGEKLAGILNYPDGDGYHPTIYLRKETHRVSDVFIEKKDHVEQKFDIVKMEMVPIQQLEHLTIVGEDEEASLYYTGLNKGFVRNALKPFEFLFISPWAFDMNVGVDKKYAPSRELHARFYTSLNVAYRQESDMWNFVRFLKFWGWNL